MVLAPRMCGLIDPESIRRSNRIKLRNQAVLSQVERRVAQGQVTYNQDGCITNRQTVQALLNPNCTFATVCYVNNIQRENSAPLVLALPAPKGPASQAYEAAFEHPRSEDLTPRAQTPEFGSQGQGEMTDEVWDLFED